MHICARHRQLFVLSQPLRRTNVERASTRPARLTHHDPPRGTGEIIKVPVKRRLGQEGHGGFERGFEERGGLG
jgi:hypothetical protein